MNQLSAQVVISAVVVWLIQLAKKSQRIPWISAETSKLNRLIAVLTSCCSAVGIHISFSAAAGTLVITGLTLTGVLTFFWHWLTAFVSQQLIFQTAVQKQLSPDDVTKAIVNAIAKAPAPVPETGAAAAGGKQ